jgi:hypothetical protein
LIFKDPATAKYIQPCFTDKIQPTIMVRLHLDQVNSSNDDSDLIPIRWFCFVSSGTEWMNFHFYSEVFFFSLKWRYFHLIWIKIYTFFFVSYYILDKGIQTLECEFKLSFSSQCTVYLRCRSQFWTHFSLINLYFKVLHNFNLVIIPFSLI